MSEFTVADDIELIAELLDLGFGDLAREIGVNTRTLMRWKSGEIDPSDRSLSLIYEYAFSKNARLNEIKAQLHKEVVEAKGGKVVFHGAKTSLDGPLSLVHSKPDNDFGRGFYCGESFEQSAMFVSGYPASSVYALRFDPTELKGASYQVDQDWMLTIAWFRGKLGSFEGHERIASLFKRLEGADYVLAPIADNRMFETIDSFIDGEITDLQCQHCLSATNLGMQYVFLNDAALQRVSILERCYLARSEKEHYLDSRRRKSSIGNDKVKAARRAFRGQGLYIDEMLA